MAAAELVGFTGIAGSGKDTAAQALKDFVHLRFAEPVYEGVWSLDPLVPDIDPEQEISRQDHYGHVRLSDYVAAFDWDVAKKNPEVRRLLQRYGTEAGRDIHGQDCWINIAKRRIRKELSESKRVKVTDVRFENEAMALAALNGCIIRVVGPPRRTGVDSSHSSEKGISDTYVSWNVVNDGTIPDLHTKILYCVDQGYQKTTQTI